MEKKLLVVIDMQNDFITGALGNPECAAVVPNVVKKVDACLKKGQDVVYTADTHDKNYLRTQEGRKLPVEHCIKPSEGWQLIPQLQDKKLLRGFEKNTFGSTELAEWIQEMQYTQVELIGVCTDICVISNAMVIKAFNPEAEISVDAACCAGVTAASHENALAAMKACQIRIEGEQNGN